MKGPRMTMQVQLLLRVMVNEPDRQQYGLELSELTGLPTGTVYPILARLEAIGWISSEWEDRSSGTRETGRPPRRYYHLTTDGAESARIALARAYQPEAARWGWLGAPGATAGGAD